MHARNLILLFGSIGFALAFCPRANPSNQPPMETGLKKQRGRKGPLGGQLDILDHPRFFDIVVRPSRQFMSKIDGTEKDEPQVGSIQSALDEEAEELDEATLAEIESGQPSEWMVMKELLGINIFTYVLAAAILFFMSLNIILGPGWLGSSLGIVPNWDMTQTADSIPETVDLSDPDFLI